MGGNGSMKYSVETTARFDKELKKGLTANRSGQWRYRIGDYRLICQIDDNKLIILALTIGHRRDIYNE